MSHIITLIKGDGIGKEIIPEIPRIIAAAGVKVNWQEALMGETAFKAYGDVLPDVTLASIRESKVAIKGPTDTPKGEGHMSANVRLRKELDLYKNIRPIKTLPGVKCRYSDTHVDLVIFREGTEDLYGGKEYLIDGGAITEKLITKRGSERICRAAFEYARINGRTSMTVLHKANIMKLTDGLFLRVAQSIANEYSYIKFSDLIIDNACAQLVKNPSNFGTILTENLYGDIISDMCAEFVGGLGLVPGANIGDECAVFEAAHGTAPDIAGKNKANPTALILSAAMMMEHIGETSAAFKIRDAISYMLQVGQFVTGDINKVNPVSTTRMVDAIVKFIKEGPNL